MDRYEERQESGAWQFRMIGHLSWLPGRAPTAEALQQEAQDKERCIAQQAAQHSCHHARAESSDDSALIAGAIGLAIGYSLGDD